MVDLMIIVAELFGAAGIDDQPSLRIALQQRGQPLAVKVIGVLVSDEYGV
jgi:uncharacterized ferritin-like protein (DUF455 family)